MKVFFKLILYCVFGLLLLFFANAVYPLQNIFFAELGISWSMIIAEFLVYSTIILIIYLVSLAIPNSGVKFGLIFAVLSILIWVIIAYFDARFYPFNKSDVMLPLFLHVSLLSWLFYFLFRRE